jgi:hypothetical protein
MDKKWTTYNYEEGYGDYIDPYSSKANLNSYEYQASLFDVDTIFRDAKQDDCILDPPIRSYLSAKVLRIVKKSIKGECLMQDKHILDIFKYFYKAYSHTVSITPDDYHWHYLLSKMDNWLLKTITDSRVLYSLLTTIAICKKFNNILQKFQSDVQGISYALRECVKEEGVWEAVKDSFDGKSFMPYYCGGNDEDDGGEKLKKLTLDLKDKLQKGIQSGIRQAKKDIDNYREFMGKTAGDNSQELDYLDIYLDPEIVKAVSVSGKSINKFVDKVIDSSTESLGGVPKSYQESIFEAEEITDIEGIENLIHPALYNDLFVKTTKYHMNFDVYLDDSGSMNGNCLIGNGKSIKQRLLVRFIALKLQKLGMLRDVYLFDSGIKKINFTELLSARLGGGTDFTQLIVNIKKTGRPGIILTDGSANMNQHSEKAYMINISSYHGQRVWDLNNAIAKMVKKGKYVYWDNGNFYKAKFETHDDYGGNPYTSIIKGSKF